jgi:uncharacterized membrane protein YesL
MKNDPVMKLIMLAILFIVIGIAFLIAITTQSVFLLLGFLIPLITFVVIFYVMTLFKKRILNNLNDSFGPNVVRIAGAVIDYFELPLTLMLSITMTLLFFAFSIIAIAFWINQFRF